METVGLQALNLTLDFDEQEVLQANRDYLVSTLEVSCRRVSAITREAWIAASATRVDSVVARY